MSQNANNLSWDLIFSHDIKHLFSMVKARKTRIAHQNFHEKLSSDFTPFTSKDQLPTIEKAMWDSGNSSFRASMTTLRNRAVFLNCYSGLLRHESIFKGELSDLLCLRHKRSDDVDKMTIQIMQIPEGKQS